MLDQAPQHFHQNSERQERNRRERVFAERIKIGDSTALEEFVEDNTGLVVSIAKEYIFGRKHLLLKDLIQEGNMALLKLAPKFNPDNENSFSSYAIPAIRRAILRAILRKDSLIRLKFSKAAQDFFSLKKEMKCVLGRHPNDEELLSEWEFLGNKRNDGEIFLQTQGRNPASLEKVSPEGDSFYLSDFYADLSPQPQQEIIDADYDLKSSVALHEALSKLPEAERRVIEGQFLKGRKTNEIAAELSVSKRSVYNIRARAITLLKESLKNQGLF